MPKPRKSSKLAHEQIFPEYNGQSIIWFWKEQPLPLPCSALQIRWEVDRTNPALGRTLYRLAMVSEHAARAGEGGEQKILEHYQAAAELLDRAVRIGEQVGTR